MNRRHLRRGSMVLEAAIMLQLLLLLTFGLLEYGWFFLKAQLVSNAARAGARVGATADADNSAVASMIATVMAAGGLGDSGYTVTHSPEDISAMEPGELLTVTVTVPYANIDLGLPLIPTPVNVVGSTVMAKEGP